MKTTKKGKIQKAFSSEALNMAFARRARLVRYDLWGIKPQIVSQGKTPAAMTLPELEKAIQTGSLQRQLPTVGELAMVAAALARTGCEHHEKLCGSALNLWFASLEAIALQNQCNQDADATGQSLDKLQKESKLEMLTLYEFLKLKMPKIQTPALRQRRFHEFLAEAYLPKMPSIKTFKGSVDLLAKDFIELAKKDGVSANAYPGLAEWVSARASAGRAIGGKAKAE
jgi:hypothetical protein